MEIMIPEEWKKMPTAVLDAAWEKGIRYFDAARSYGLAEKFLSSWLRKKKIRTRRDYSCIKVGIHIYSKLANRCCI